ncbi:MAG: hypothetical protein IJ257_06660 [Treponema sp.]|nr:hypothetical protein [Treponema sp.]
MKKKLFLIALVSLISMQLFSASMNSKVRKVPKNIQDGIFTDPKENIIDLTKFLASGSNDTASKVKIFHDWICDNIAYDCDVFTENGAGEQGYETVLKKRRAVCVGYANLLAVMCQVVDIECEIVYGWSKGFNYPGYLRKESDHAWNAVKIGGKWKLIDVTWDAGFVERRSFIKHYTNQWYNLTPGQFIYSHFPEEEKWQLLPEKQIRSPQQFEKEPYLPGIFFEFGLAFGKTAPDYSNVISGMTYFEVTSSKSNVRLNADIYGDGPADTTNAVFYANNGNSKRIIFDVPDKELYTLRVGANDGTVKNPTFFSKTDFEQKIIPEARGLVSKKKISQNEYNFFEKSFYLIEENGRYYFSEDLFDNQRNNAVTKILKLLGRNTNRYENMFSVEVTASEDYAGFGQNVMRFPQMYRDYNVKNMELLSPLTGSLQKKNEQHFEIKTSVYSKIAIVLGEGDFVFFQKNQKNGVFELDFTIPEDAANIDVYASKDGKQYITIISYQVN